MNKIFCPRCGTENSSEMAFCTNCGQSFAAPGSQPGTRPSPNPFPTAPPSQVPTVSMAAPAKSGNGLLLGLLGCGGLIVVLLIGLFVGGAVMGLRNSGQSNTVTVNSNSNLSISNSGSNSRSSNSNGNSVETLDTGALDEMRSLKQVGVFKQTDVKNVPAGDFYPSATEAVQATFQKGKQTVVSIVAQFPTAEPALAAFDDRLKTVKDGGGKIYNKVNKDGTKGAAYKYKEYYYVEACAEALCWRNYSTELNAVRIFAVSFPAGPKPAK